MLLPIYKNDLICHLIYDLEWLFSRDFFKNLVQTLYRQSFLKVELATLKLKKCVNTVRYKRMRVWRNW